MKPLLLTILLISLLALSATAQNADREVYPQQASINHNDAVKSFSTDYIFAFANNMQGLTAGIGNTAGVYVEGSGNHTVLSQQGYGNYGIIDIDGSGNQTSMQQSGFDLLSILSIEGNANEFDMMQEGSGLQNYLKIYGSGSNFEAQQNNAGMNFRQSGNGAIPLSIQQTGNPSPIIIRNN